MSLQGTLLRIRSREQQHEEHQRQAQELGQSLIGRLIFHIVYNFWLVILFFSIGFISLEVDVFRFQLIGRSLNRNLRNLAFYLSRRVVHLLVLYRSIVHSSRNHWAE